MLSKPSHPLLPPSPFGFSLFQNQDLFQWIGSSHQVAKVFELQHRSLKWSFLESSDSYDLYDLSLEKTAVIVSLGCQLCIWLTPSSLGLAGSHRTYLIFLSGQDGYHLGYFAEKPLGSEAPNSSSFPSPPLSLMLPSCWEDDMPLTASSQHWAKSGSPDLWLWRVNLLVFYMSAQIQGCWAYRGTWLVIRTTVSGTFRVCEVTAVLLKRRTKHMEKRWWQQ